MGREEKFASSGHIPAWACWTCYISVLLGFSLMFAMPQHSDPWHNGFLASLETTVLVWFFSLFFRNTSIYDPYWCFFPIYCAGCWIATANAPQSPRGWLAYALLWAWCLRYNIQWTWEGWTIGIHSEDWRYLLMAKALGIDDSVGVIYWVIVSLIGAHIVPTLLVWFVMGPVQFVWTSGSNITMPLNLFDLIGATVSIGGVLLQLVSDRTLRTFREKHINGQVGSIETEVCCKICREGPWSYSRHPNYLGEVLFWVGMNILAAGAGQSVLGLMWSIGAVLNYTIFFRISSSLMDARSLRNRPGYAQVMLETSALIPCPLFVDRLLDKILVKEAGARGKHK